MEAVGRWKQWAGLRLEGKVRMAEVQDEAAAAGRSKCKLRSISSAVEIFWMVLTGE